MKFTRVSESEVTTVDPITGGVWRVVSNLPLSDTAATLAIGITLLKEDKRPKRDATLTIEFDAILKTDCILPHPAGGLPLSLPALTGSLCDLFRKAAFRLDQPPKIAAN